MGIFIHPINMPDPKGTITLVIYGNGRVYTFRNNDVVAKAKQATSAAVKAKWIDNEPENRLIKSNMPYYCSNCLHRAGKNKHKVYKFCPWCGADMRETPKEGE